METGRDPAEQAQQSNDEPAEGEGALNKDNPTPPQDAGQKGGGTSSGASGGLEEGSEPRDQDVRQHERP